MPPELLLTNQKLDSTDWTILDVRDLADDGTNYIADYDYRIRKAVSMIKFGKKVAVCCGAGMSRSNAIALGVLVKHENMDFFDAWELIRETVPICEIEPSHISKLKKLFNVTVP